MNEKSAASGELIKAYADRFLAVLERIAVALETKNRGYTTTDWPKETRFDATDSNTPPPLEVGPVVAYDTVREALLAYQDTHGGNAAKEVLKAFGVKYITDLKATPERYADILKALQ
jgi:hypothetical protein